MELYGFELMRGLKPPLISKTPAYLQNGREELGHPNFLLGVNDPRRRQRPIPFGITQRKARADCCSLGGTDAAITPSFFS